MAFLVDGESYFAAVREAILRAREGIWIVGWDLDPGVELLRGEEAEDGYPTALGDLLCAVLDERPSLHARLLVWDFAMVYAFEREWVPLYSLACRKHARLRLVLDGRHPVGASHHQKIVVVDDSIAFCGGMDLSKWRWDTSAHAAENELRVDANGKRYPPYHDVQMLVDGEAAADLGRLVRERWKSALQGERDTVPPSSAPNDPWPPSIAPDLRDVDVGIVRTAPAPVGGEEIRETESFHVAALAAAQEAVYIENQYLSSHAVVSALEEMLRAESGPEILVVLPRRTGGWLEQTTMDVLRARALERLRAADHRGRLRVSYPTTPGLGDECISVHSKLMVVDDSLTIVGSANLSNRSMGLDTECGLAIEAEDPKTRAALAKLRDALVAEHLGVERSQVVAAIRETGSLLRAVERLGGGERRLEPLDGTVSEELDAQVPDAAILDPEAPLDPDRLVDLWLSSGSRDAGSRRVWALALTLVVLVALVAAWRLTPLRDLVRPEELASELDGRTGDGLGVLVVVVTFVIGTAVGLPSSVLVVATALVFGPWWGAVYSLLGAWVASLSGYGAGHWLGRDVVRRLAGDTLNGLSRRLERGGVLAVILIRILPLAPFAVINFVAGATSVRFKDFAIGSALGMLPGVIGLTIFAESVHVAFVDPGRLWWAIVAAVLVAVSGTAWWLRTRARGEADR